MTLPIYPSRTLLPGLTYSSKWSPRFINQSFATASGAEIDLAIAQYPLHDFELNYAFLRDGVDWHGALADMELRTMMGFFLSIGGTRGRFLYRNPDDHQVFRNRIGTGDGSTTVFTIIRTLGANGYFGTEPVGQVDTAAGVNVYLGGSATPQDPAVYTISTATPVANTITFNSAPANGAAIEIDMSYFYYCKLSADTLTFEKFMSRVWSLGQVTLHSCRPGT